MNQNQPNPPKKRSKEEAPPQSSTPESNPLQQILAMLAPMMDFHKTVEDAQENDLRLYWDVRIVQGKDTPFMNTTGSTSLPGILHGSRRGQACDSIQKEIIDKIALPLSARIQDMVCDGALSEALAGMAMLPPPPADRDDEIQPAAVVAEAALQSALDDESIAL